MTRKLMAGSAMIALMAAGAFSVAQAQTDPAADAQQPAAMEQPATGADQGAAPAAGEAPAGGDAAATEEPPEPTSEIAADAPTLTPDEPTIATAFIGRSVFSSENPDSDNIGEVNDLIIGSDGKITHAVVGVGGFLGIGEKDVSVPFDQLQVVQTGEGDVRLIYAATREQLEAAEAFDRTAFDPEERVQEQQEAAAETDAAAGGAPAGGTATAPGALPGAAIDPAANPPPPPETQTAATEPPAAPVAESEPAAGTDPAAMPVTAGEGGFVAFSADQVRASTMIGQEVYGAENEAIGEVSDLIMQPEGETRAALIDVGGFLGIGEKRVAIPFNEIKMMQPTQTAAADPAAPPADPAAPPADPAAAPAVDPAAPATAPAATADPAAPASSDPAAAEPRLTVAMTRQQLEQLPAWEDPQMAANNAAAPPAPPAGTDPSATAGAPADPNAPPAGAGAPPAQPPETQFQPVTQDVTVENLMGAAVLGANDEDLGEVGDVVFDPNGEIQAVVVDVGGFLGMGAKSVAVQFDSLNVQSNENGDIRLKANASREQLENAPTYDAAAQEAGQPQPAAQ